MKLVSDSQWEGWFGNLGSAGVIIQNVITAVSPFLVSFIAILFVVQIFKIGTSISQANGPEERREGKIRISWLLIALVFSVVGPTIILILMNTIGNTIEIPKTEIVAVSQKINSLILKI